MESKVPWPASPPRPPLSRVPSNSLTGEPKSRFEPDLERFAPNCLTLCRELASLAARETLRVVVVHRLARSLTVERLAGLLMVLGFVALRFWDRRRSRWRAERRSTSTNWPVPASPPTTLSPLSISTNGLWRARAMALVACRHRRSCGPACPQRRRRRHRLRRSLFGARSPLPAPPGRQPETRRRQYEDDASLAAG